MQINNINYSNKPNFGSTQIFKVKLHNLLPNKSIEKVDAFISELDEEDTGLFIQYRPFLNKIAYGDTISGNFIADLGFQKPTLLSGKKYLMVECPQFAKDKQIKAISESQIGEDNIELETLGANQKDIPRLKGAGSCILYALAKLAKKLDLGSVTLTSRTEAMPFYEKLGLKKVCPNSKDYILHNAYFDDFIQKLEKKYDIQEI